MGIFRCLWIPLSCARLPGCASCAAIPPCWKGSAHLFAYEGALGEWGGRAVSLCTALFALATPLAWCCYGREGLFYLTGEKGEKLVCSRLRRRCFLGCVLPLTAVFQIGMLSTG